MLSVLISTFVLFALLAAAAYVDIRTMRIPNALNALIVFTGLGATWWLEKPLIAALIGVALGYGALLALNLGYRAIRGRDGMGMGDAKLLAGGGAWLGWSGLPFVLLIGSALGLAYVAALRIAGRQLSRTDALAFGPFLGLGIFIAWLVMNFYWPSQPTNPPTGISVSHPA